MAWNRKANRIADLEARNAHLLAQLETKRGGHTTPEPASSQAATVRLLHATEAQLGAARQRIDRLNGSLASTQQRITTSEQARTELAFLIAEHITRGSSIEALRKRVDHLGHGEAVDHMTKLIGDLDAEPAAIAAAAVTPATAAPAVAAGEVTAP